MGSVQEFFEGLAARVTPDRIEGMNNTYVFDIEGAGTLTVVIADGAIQVTEGAGDADTTFRASDRASRRSSPASRTRRRRTDRQAGRSAATWAPR